jgi:16S rRNA (guanine1207-N2)-methyltransferase
MDPALASRDRANRLFDAYGALLTPQQRQLLRRYYQHDLSLGEIAGQTRVSRQAVHDGLRRAIAALERYEAALGLVKGNTKTEHYFSRRPASAARSHEISAVLRGRRWAFQTSSGVFARRGVDPGSRLLIESVQVRRADHVLDLGCGYGPVGLVMAALVPQGRVWLVDTNERAARLALANAARNRVANVGVVVADGASAVREGCVDVVITNPPVRAGRQVVRAFIDGAWRALRPGGRLCLVARTRQGARTIARLMTERFGDVRQVALAQGYRVYEAVRSGAPGSLPGRVKEHAGV